MRSQSSSASSSAGSAKTLGSALRLKTQAIASSPLAPDEGQDGVVVAEEREVAGGQGRRALAQRDHLAGEGERRLVVGGLGLDGQVGVLGRGGQPGVADGETQRRAGAPGHRRAAAVAAAGIGPVEVADGIAQLVAGQRRLRQAQFLALVDQGRALEAEQQGEEQPGEFGRGVVAAEPAHRARHVVVRERDGRPMRRIGGERRIVPADEVRRQLAGQQEDEGVGRMQALGRREIGAAARFLLGELPEHEAVWKGLDPAADDLERLDVLRQVGVEKVALQVTGVGPVVAGPLGHRDRRIVGQGGVVQEGAGHVEPEAVDALRQPEVQHAQGGLSRGVAAPIELRLLAQELVVVVLPPGRLVGPGPDRRTPRASCWARSRLPRVSAQTYQSALGPSWPPVRLSTNQGCSSEVCDRTSSKRTFIRRAWGGVQQRLQVVQVP